MGSLRLCGLALAIFSITHFVAVRSAEAQLSQDIGLLISEELPGFRLAQQTDYIALAGAKDRGQPMFQEDFNQDGRRDWAVVVVNDRLREYRIYFVLSRANGYEFDLLFTRNWKEPSKTDPINTPMFLKGAGDPGISDRIYNSLADDLDASVSRTERLEIRNRKAAVYRSVPAIEVWTGQKHDETDRNLEDISYCSTTWYYEKDQLKNFGACD